MVGGDGRREAKLGACLEGRRFVEGGVEDTVETDELVDVEPQLLGDGDGALVLYADVLVLVCRVSGFGFSVEDLGCRV